MSTLPRLLWSTVICFSALSLRAADASKDAPAAPAAAPAPSVQLENLEFAGVSTLGKKTMINLFEKVEKRSFWVEAGVTSGGVTVTNYDSAHDQVTVRVNGKEKLLPLRAASAVVNAPASGVPASAPIAAPSAGFPSASTSTPSTSLSQARQEEEARMLVSDLLEIGMAQRRAYEEAQRRAAAGQSPVVQPANNDQPAQSALPNAAASPAQSSGNQPAQPTGSTTPSN